MADQEVQMVKLEVMVPKELAEVSDLLVSVARDFKAKHAPLQIAYDSFGKLRDVLEGTSLVAAELKTREVYTLAAITVAQMLDIFLPVKAAASAAAPAAAALGSAEVPAPGLVPDVAPAAKA